MSIEALDQAVQETNRWLKELSGQLGITEPRVAYGAWRAVLHAIRDRVGPDHAAHLAAQLPLLLRGSFLEGYRPRTHTQAELQRERSRGAVLEHVHTLGARELDLEPERAVKAVLATLANFVGQAEIDQLARLFPDELRDLWPEAPLESGAPMHARPAEAERRRTAAPALQRPGRTPQEVPPATGIDELDRSLQAARQWSDAVEFRMNAHSPRLAFSALQATLQGVREQLDTEPALAFAAHLPLALQGVYFEGWRPPTRNPVATCQEFLDRIEAVAFHQQGVVVKRAVKAALDVISKKIPAAEMASVASALPQDLRTLWPGEPLPYTDPRASPPLQENLAPPPPPRRGAKNLRHGRGRAPGETTPNAVVPARGRGKRSE